MSHRTGTLQTITPAIQIGPDTSDAPTFGNTWVHDFTHAPAPTGTKLVILHFQNVNLPPGNRLEVDLGYDTDVFTSADGNQFWTRPVNIYVLAGGLVPIRYVADGSLNGSVELDRYGRGERLSGEQDPSALSNSDPFQELPVYAEPIYDPFWYCDEQPNWENVACVAAPDARAIVARSVGMIVTVHEADNIVSTCSVTLVDEDKVLTAGHCVNPIEALTSSVTFDYETDCVGNRPGGYNARFYKVVEVLEQRYVQGSYDYALLRLAESPPGLTPIQMRHDLPSSGEQVFGIHHPNGAVKKLSIPNPNFSSVLGSSQFQIRVPLEFDVSGGSSGSGLFDAAGRVVGILANGNPCGNPPWPTSDLNYFPTATFFTDTVPEPPAPITRGVMIVFDRSGSMSQDDGTGRTKIEVARDAASLFVQLVRSSVGNGLGLVSFGSSASSPIDFELVGVTSANKNDLIGPAPYAGGIVGGLSSGGHTSIGGGLDAARAELQSEGFNPQAILLLTDGRQNREPMIEDVEDSLGDIAVHAIGFGTEANLNGELLTQLAADHDGLYMRAGNGLALEKFFTEAFGNIFETGVLFDPEFDLPANESGELIPIPVCGETMFTVVTGWDRTDTSLSLEITSPGGAVIRPSTPGAESSTGRTWSFLRVTLPHAGERDGLWQVRVVRPTGSTEFPPPTPALHYFIDVIPTGGPRLQLAGNAFHPRRRYYTGDFIGPLVMLCYDDGGWPHHADVKLTLSRPNKSTGNILTEAGLGPPTVIDGDTVSARDATLQAIEAASGNPVVQYVESSFTLGSRPADTGGLFESAGVYGTGLSDKLTVEGNYTMHVKATYGGECQGARELSWSFSVAVGVDADNTSVTSIPTGTQPDGTECLRLTITPRDRYGNYLGPGRITDLEIEPQPGTTLTSIMSDLGNGSYQVDVCWDPASGDSPQIGIVQPERPTVVVTPKDVRRFVYSVKFICGEQTDDCHGCTPVLPGRYATEINIQNFHNRQVGIQKQVIPLVLAGAVRGREPQVAGVTARDKILLPPHSATMDDCCRIVELLLGAKPNLSVSLTMGLLEITSLMELSVTAVYTATDLNNGSLSVDVQQIAPKRS
ncbi:MAG TPA: trypsin-like peptidase domain-containing protein [Nitrosomonas nitrosa]|nr:trypsin-like peptidase domain-containing protein [Nitrosomonas nitrosa]